MTKKTHKAKPKQQKRKTIGLALGSGGIRGLAHVGVIRAFVKHGIPIDYIAGTSMGAWVGAYYAKTLDLAMLEKLTVETKQEKLMALLEPNFFNGGIIKGKKFTALMEQWLGKDTQFEDLQIPTSVVATDLYQGESVAFDSGLLVPAVRASMAIPIMFQPVIYQNRVLVDGGITNPLPDNVVRAMGADIVIAVNLDHVFKNVERPKKINMRSVALRTVHVMRQNLGRYSVKEADVVIEPAMHLVGVNAWTEYFRNHNIQEVADAGEQAADAMMPAIKALLKK